MKRSMRHAETTPLMVVELAKGDALLSTAAAVVAHAPSVDLEVRAHATFDAPWAARLRALGAAIVRRLIGATTFFAWRLSARSGGFAWLAPPRTGDMAEVELDGGSLWLMQGAFVAAMGRVVLSVRFGGLRALLTRQHAYLVQARGVGTVVLGAAGHLEETRVEGALTVDPGHLVAFEPTLTARFRGPRGKASAIIDHAEGSTCELSGHGRVWLQSRSDPKLVRWLAPLLAD